MIDTNFDYRLELKCLLTERQKRNARYSLRAMARDLNISLTALHGVIKGDRHLSKKNLESISTRLERTPSKLDQAINSTRILNDPTETMLTEDRFRFISDWVHLAILNLARMPNIDVSTVANRLAISEDEATDALDRLKRLGFININQSCLQRLEPSFGILSKEVSSAAIRAFHHNNLEKAHLALDELGLNERHFLTIAAPSSYQKLKELKIRIDEFRKEVLQILSTPKPEQVFFLNIQVFPVTREPQV